MNKETIIAILVGFGFGLAAALLILFLPKLPLGKSQEQKTHITTKELNKETSSEKELSSKSNAKLTINSPEQNAVINSDAKEVEITGKAPEGTRIVFLSLAGEKSTKSDGSGNFSVKMPLVEGENKIQAVAYKDNKDPQVKILTIYYVE